MNLDSVLLFVFSFCFCDMDTIATFPIVNFDPVCELKYECTTNSASIENFRQLFLSDFNEIRNYWVPNIYFISLSSFFQSPWLGCFTLEHKTEFLGWMYGLALLYENKPLATVVWNNYDLLLLRVLLPSNLNIYLVARLATAWDLSIFIGNSSIIFFTSFCISFFTSNFVV